MKTIINRTLNEVLSFITTGANYASNLAKELNKSIPVTYRQLEALVDENIIQKYRDGKKVLYKIQWNVLSPMIAEEYVNYAERKKEHSNLKGWKNFRSENLKAATREFFGLIKTQDLLAKFLVMLRTENKNYDFITTIRIFCEALGKADSKKINALYKGSKEAGLFLEFCRLLQEEEMKSDVREKFSKSL